MSDKPDNGADAPDCCRFPGDVIPAGPLRLLAGAECLNGLLLIGWSASYIYISMERFWNQGNSDGCA